MRIDLSHEKPEQEYLKWAREKGPVIETLTEQTMGLLVFIYLLYLREEEIEFDRKVIDDR